MKIEKLASNYRVSIYHSLLIMLDLDFKVNLKRFEGVENVLLK